MQAYHHFVAVSFSQHRSSGYRQIYAVASDDGLMRDTRIFAKPVTIDQNEFGFYFLSVDSSVHRQNRGFQYVYLIDFVLIGDSDRPADGFTLNDRT